MNYEYPIKRGEQPMEIQRITTEFMVRNPHSFVFSEMRTGKTRAALWAADRIMRLKPRGNIRTLIVANLSTLRRTWQKEIFDNFLGKRSSVVLHGSAKRREELLNEDHDFYIINHDGLGVGHSAGGKLEGLAAALLSRMDIKLVIVDEASAYRASNTQRHKVARLLLQKRPYLWLMTGTPTSNGPMDCYGLKKLIDPGFKESFRSLQGRLMLQVSPFKWLPRQGAHEEVASILSPAVRFTQEDCFDAPPVTVEMRDAELSAQQKKAFTELRKQLALKLESGVQINAANEAVVRQKLIQICCGCVYDAEHKAHSLDSAPRLAVLKEVLEEAPRKVIIFAPLTSVLNSLYSQLSGYSREIVNGEVPEKERSEILSRFQTTDTPRILIAHPGPIARGLDLTAAATIVWYGPTDRTEDYVQANQRINGPAQKFSRSIIQIASTPVEREIFRRLEANEALQGAILKLMERE